MGGSAWWTLKGRLLTRLAGSGDSAPMHVIFLRRVSTQTGETSEVRCGGHRHYHLGKSICITAISQDGVELRPWPSDGRGTGQFWRAAQGLPSGLRQPLSVLID